MPLSWKVTLACRKTRTLAFQALSTAEGHGGLEEESNEKTRKANRDTYNLKPLSLVRSNSDLVLSLEMFSLSLLGLFYFKTIWTVARDRPYVPHAAARLVCCVCCLFLQPRTTVSVYSFCTVQIPRRTHCLYAAFGGCNLDLGLRLLSPLSKILSDVLRIVPTIVRFPKCVCCEWSEVSEREGH